MRPLGPIETFEPALDRTRTLLFRPFRLGRTWKLAVSAYLALSGSIFIPLPLPLAFFPHPARSVLVWSLFTLFTVILFAFYYLGSRMQFVLFDLVVTLDRLVAPLWRLRRPSLIWRWIGIKLAVTLPLALFVLLPLIPVFRRLFALLPRAFPAGIPPANAAAPLSPLDPGFFPALLSLYAVLFGAMAVLFLASSLLSDLILPFLALENASARSAFARAFALVRSEPATFLGFLTFQILLAIVGLVAQYAVAIAASLLAAIPLVLLALAGYALLHTVLSPLLLTIAGLLLYIGFLIITMYLQLGSFGVLIIFLRAYSLLFLGGRYPPLGDRLYPPAPPFVAPGSFPLSPPPPLLP